MTVYEFIFLLILLQTNIFKEYIIFSKSKILDNQTLALSQSWSSWNYQPSEKKVSIKKIRY